jgi:DNA-binding transcriptional LysR family regulator
MLVARRFPRVDFDWNDIPLLLKLADTGSMSQAGRVLGLDASTVSRRVAAAEKALNVRLFIREPTGYQPTDAGKVFLAHAEEVFDRIETMLVDTRAEAEGVSGTVNVTAIDVLFTHWLVRYLPELLGTHPALQVNLIGDNRDLSFTRREADLAIRLSRPNEDAALRMRKVGELGFAVYGADEFAGLPREQWPTIPWLAYPAELSRMPEMRWLAALEPRQLARMSSVSMILRACQEGAGLALLPCIAADRAGLRRVEAEPVLRRELWLLSHRDAGHVARFTAVTEWLHGHFETDASALRG